MRGLDRRGDAADREPARELERVVDECVELYLEGIDTPSTASGPSASTAIVATSAESTPPESAITALANPFFAR